MQFNVGNQVGLFVTAYIKNTIDEKFESNCVVILLANLLLTVR